MFARKCSYLTCKEKAFGRDINEENGDFHHVDIQRHSVTFSHCVSRELCDLGRWSNKADLSQTDYGVCCIDIQGLQQLIHVGLLRSNLQKSSI